MFKLLLSLSKPWKLFILVLSYIITALCFSLLIAGVVDDGFNQFAKAFTYTRLEEVKNPHFDVILNKLNAVLSSADLDGVTPYNWLVNNGVEPSFTVPVSEQNTIGLAFFVSTMVILAVFTLSVATSLTFITYRLFFRTVQDAYDEKLIDENEFKTIFEIVKTAKFNYKDRKRAKARGQFIEQLPTAETDE